MGAETAEERSIKHTDTKALEIFLFQCWETKQLKKDLVLLFCSSNSHLSTFRDKVLS